MTTIDVETGEMTRGLPQSDFPVAQNRENLRRSQADELFAPVDPTVIQDLRRGLASLPDQVFNMPREDFYRALDRDPKRHA